MASRSGGFRRLGKWIVKRSGDWAKHSTERVRRLVNETDGQQMGEGRVARKREAGEMLEGSKKTARTPKKRAAAKPN